MADNYQLPMQVIPAAERTAQQWVDYYLQIESDLLAGKEVSFDDGRKIMMEDLANVRRGRFEWERRAKMERTGGRCGNAFGCGGITYMKPDMTR